ncbi:MAG: 8-oxo-dGTP diphosphatase [Verrucomicrobiota bacterium]
MTVDWEAWQPTMWANLLFVQSDDQVLLIRKKTGLGKGKINGPGGKLEPGETALESAVREIEEELCIQVKEADCEEMGVLRFQFVDGLALHCVVFRTFRYEGTPTETREARPHWFPLDAIPFEEMWADDRHWLREMLDGRRFEGNFVFDEEVMLAREIVWKG